MKLLLSLVLSFSSIVLILAQEKCTQTADSLFNQAVALVQSGENLKAADVFAQTVRIEQSCTESRLSDLVFEQYNAAQCYAASGQAPKAVQFYGDAEKNYVQLGQIADAIQCALPIQQLLLSQKEFKQLSEFSEVLRNQSLTLHNSSLQWMATCVLSTYLSKTQQLDSARKILYPIVNSPASIHDSLHLEIKALAIMQIAALHETMKQPDSALVYYQQAVVLYQQIQHPSECLDAQYHSLEMLAALRQCAAAYQLISTILPRLQQNNNLALMIAVLNTRANCLVSEGKYTNAIAEYQQSLNIANQTGNMSAIASINNNIALIYKQQGKYAEALLCYQQAFRLFNFQDELDNAATCLSNMGTIYITLGQYDKAIETFNGLLTTSRAEGNTGIQAALLNNIGGVYTSWGQYEKALLQYQESLKLLEGLNQWNEIGRTNNNLGGIYDLTGDAEMALQYYSQALQNFQQVNNASGMLSVYNNLGSIAQVQGNTEKASSYYQQALSLALQLHETPTAGVVLDNLGQLYGLSGNIAEAEKCLQQSIDIRRQLHEPANLAVSLNNLAVLCLTKGDFTRAIQLLGEAIQLLEDLRQTAKGDVRRDYLNSQVGTYQNMIIALLKNKDFERAFYYIELSRAKLLAENIALHTTLQQPSLAEVQASLPPDALALIYATVDNHEISLLSVTRNTVAVHFIQKEVFLKRLLADDAVKQRVVSGLRMSEIEQLHEFVAKGKKMDKLIEKKIFGNTITLYSQMITQMNSKDISKTKFLGRELFDLLINPIANELNNKRSIVVMHEGVLGFLPFETLLDAKRQYLVMNYNISYINSFTVNKLVRNRQYPANRKTMIAMGVSDYDAASTTPQLAYSGSIDDIKHAAFAAIDSNKNMTSLYQNLGFSKFNNLAGSRDELQTIRSIFADADTLSNAQVNETRIKELSQTGELAKYRIIHFSTHGIAVPEIPELSALIVWRQAQASSGNEGYLRMEEIAHLDLQADFANLSACETALGKVYGGEGIVGLSQSFLIAGANSLSVSLWQVDETSTAVFMRLLYQELRNNNFQYLDAINDIKRRFLLGNEGVVWRQPFFWAPFVYYGF